MIDGVNDLRDERFFCGLTDVESELELVPDIFSSCNLCGRAGRRSEDTGIGRANPRDGVRQGSVPGVGQDESEMAVLAATKGGGDRSGIGLDLGRESL